MLYGEAASFGRIETEEVTFSYPGSERVALRGVSMRIEPGEVVALAGANGPGKTTLAKLLAGPYLPTEGRVCWDGRDTREVTSREPLPHSAIVFQDFIRYALSAGDNIALGRHERWSSWKSRPRRWTRRRSTSCSGRSASCSQTVRCC